MIQCTQQKVAEPAPFRLGPSQGTFRQQVDEEILCEVLRILAAVAAAANEGVNRIAIEPKEFLQGNPSFRRAFSRSGYHQLPLGRAEVGPPPSRGVK
jgi:hypothetical protein